MAARALQSRYSRSSRSAAAVGRFPLTVRGHRQSPTGRCRPQPLTRYRLLHTRHCHDVSFSSDSHSIRASHSRRRTLAITPCEEGALSAGCSSSSGRGSTARGLTTEVCGGAGFLTHVVLHTSERLPWVVRAGTASTEKRGLRYTRLAPEQSPVLHTIGSGSCVCPLFGSNEDP